MLFSEPPRTSPQQDAAVTGGPLPPPPPSSQQPQPYIQVSCFSRKRCIISRLRLLLSRVGNRSCNFCSLIKRAQFAYFVYNSEQLEEFHFV